MGLSKTVTLVGVSSVVLVAVAIAVAVTLNKHNEDAKFSTANKSVKTMCEATDYKDACAKSLSSSNSDDPKELMKTSFKAAISDINEVVGKSKTLQDASKDSRTKDAYKLCKDLLETSVNDFDRSGDKVGKFEASKMEEYVADVKTWLTGAIDYQETCIDAFQNTTGDAGEKMKDLLKSSHELSSNSLAMVSDIKSIVSNLNIPGLHRRLFDYDYPPPGDPPPSEDPGSGASTSSRRLFDAAYGPPNDHSLTEDPGQGAESTVRRVFGKDNKPQISDGSPSHNSEHISKGHKVTSLKELPEWVGTHHRNLLQANPKPNAVVALDGSGQFKSINEALKTVPPNNVKAFVILVKAGIYNEYVDVPRHTDNIVMIGEGATKTKVTGNKNFIDGVPTFQTATFGTLLLFSLYNLIKTSICAYEFTRR